MNEFLPRLTPPAPATSAKERSAPLVRAVSQARAAQSESEADASLPRHAQGREHATAAADYARIHAEIADVLAGLRQSPARRASPAQEADSAILALMPSPVVMLPQPPTDEQMVAFVAQVAQAMARQAAQTRAAQAVATPIMRQAAAH